MLTISQNKKIAISAIALFLVSFVGMLFFLKTNGTDMDNGKVNILEVGGHEEEVVEEVDDVDDPVEEVEVKVVDKETMYREYVEDDNNPIIVMDAESKITFATNDACELLEKECDDMMGGSFFELINTNDLPEMVTDHMELTNNPKLTEGIGPYRMLHGEENILVIFKAYPVVNENGKVTDIVYSIKDITEQVLELNGDAAAEIDGEIAYSDLL